MVKLLLLLGPLLSMVAGGSARPRGGETGLPGDSGATDLGGGNDAETDPHVATAEDDPDRGYRAFGRMVEKVTLLGVLIMALLVVGLILSLAGVFESDIWDPPV